MKLLAYYLLFASAVSFFSLGSALADETRPRLDIFLPGRTAPQPPPISQVIAWGSNGDGQTTVPAAAQSGVAAIAAGHYHSIALKQDGSVVAWGWNGSGQCVVPAKAQSGVVAIAAGANHTVALKHDGSVIVWGFNYKGLTDVPASAQSNVVAITAGFLHSVALKLDGSVIAWGSNDYGQCTVPVAAQSGVIDIVAHGDHTVALKLDGSVIAWGRNNYGQCNVPESARSGVVAVAAGAYHTVALKQDRSVIAWGYDSFDVSIVPASAYKGVTALTAGSYNVTAIDQYGGVLIWGRDYLLNPVPADAKRDVTAIASGSGHMVALKIQAPQLALGEVISGDAVETTITLTSAGTEAIHSLKAEIYGVDANQFTITSPELSPILPLGASANVTVRFTAHGGGSRRAMLKVTSNDLEHSPYFIELSATAIPALNLSYTGGARLTWPRQEIDLGTLDTGSRVDRSFTLRNDGTQPLTGLRMDVAGKYPTQIAVTPPLPSTLDVGESVSFTLQYSALQADEAGNTLQFLTDQANEPPLTIQLTANIHAPKLAVSDIMGRLDPSSQGFRLLSWGDWYSNQIVMPDNAQDDLTAIAAGDNHVLALKQDGRVFAWGDNFYGQSIAPEAAQTGVVAISAGFGRSAALKQDGSVIEWGTWGMSTLPAASQSGVLAISAGSFNTLALKNDGSIIAWGDEGFGQKTVPVAAQSGVIAIAAGGLHSVALKQDGHVVAWGQNYAGQTDVPAGLSNVLAVSAGSSHSVALKRDGGVVAWGRSEEGQIAVPVAAQSGVVSIAAGSDHTVALKQDGSVVVWGDNRYGNRFVPDAAQSGVVAISAGGNHTMALGKAELYFGSRQIGQSREKALFITSAGSLSLDLSATIIGPDADQFSIVGSLPTRLVVGGSSALTLRFTPTRVGSLTAHLKINSNDPAIPIYLLPLSGKSNFEITAIKTGVGGGDFRYGPLHADRQTGLMLQRISFTNTTSGSMHGLRLILSNVAKGVTLFSSSAGTVPGTLEVIYSNAIAAGDTISFDLVYFDPKRRTADKMNPIIKAEALLEPEPDSLPVTGTVVPLRSVLATSQGPWLIWKSVQRASYVVEYSDDDGTTWFSAVHRLTSAGKQMFWIDRGQPETKTVPYYVPKDLQHSREYRVKRL